MTISQMPASPALGCLALAAALCLCACASAAPPVSPSGGVARAPAPRRAWQAADFHPLAIGNRWTYRGTLAGQEVERTVTIRGIEQGFFVDDANGRLKVDADGLRDDKRYLIRNPVARGQKWMAVLSVTSTERYEIVETGLAVDTPKGHFEDCIQVRAINRIDAGRALESDWFYAPGVGIVRMQTRLRDGDRVIPQAHIELADYRIERI